MLFLHWVTVMYISHEPKIAGRAGQPLRQLLSTVLSLTPPGGVAGSGQIIQAPKVTLVMFPSFTNPIYTVVILTIPHLKQTQGRTSVLSHTDVISQRVSMTVFQSSRLNPKP